MFPYDILLGKLWWWLPLVLQLEWSFNCTHLWPPRLQKKKKKRRSDLIDYSCYWRTGESYYQHAQIVSGFPGSSDGKESAHNARDLGSIPGLGRSPGEGISYQLQYSWAFLVAQLIKNLPATRETWVQSLGQEDPMEKGMATHSNVLAWRTLWTDEPGRLQSMGGLYTWLVSVYKGFFVPCP